MVWTVSLSGSIGVGKSTLAAGLAKRLNRAFVVPENVGTLHFLPLFYEDESKYALHSRLEFLILKARQLGLVDEANDFAILDRSLAELITFARALVATGAMSRHDFALYEGIYDLVLSKVRSIDLVVWVRAAPEVMLSRIKARGRSFEKAITREYLEAIDAEYEIWFKDISTGSKLIVDTTSLSPDDAVDKAAVWLREAAQ